MSDKKADLAGPGIGDYAELKEILPKNYSSILDIKETQQALFETKNYIERNLCKEYYHCHRRGGRLWEPGGRRR